MSLNDWFKAGWLKAHTPTMTQNELSGAFGKRALPLSSC